MASTILAWSGAPAVLEETAVGDLVGERVLEGVLEVREQARLVEELGPLEVASSRRRAVLGMFRDRPEEVRMGRLPDDRRRLKEALLLEREPVDARGERIACAVAGICHASGVVFTSR